MLFKTTISSFTERHIAENFNTGSALIQTDNILDMKLEGSDDSLITYQLRDKRDADVVFQFVSTHTLAQVTAGANVSANSNLVALPVYEGEDTTSTAVSHYFNIDQIKWAYEDSSGNRTYIKVQEGAKLVQYLINYDLDQIMDIATTGTTTTTTTTA